MVNNKNFVIFSVDNSSSMNADNKKKAILVSGECPMQELIDTMITAKVKCYQIKKCLSLHYNESNSLLYANGIKVYQFKAKDLLEITRYPLCLDNISKDFTVDDIKNRIKWICLQFFC